MLSGAHKCLTQQHDCPSIEPEQQDTTTTQSCLHEDFTGIFKQAPSFISVFFLLGPQQLINSTVSGVPDQPTTLHTHDGLEHMPLPETTTDTPQDIPQ